MGMGYENFEDGEAKFTSAEDERGHMGEGHDVWKMRQKAQIGML